MGALTKRDCVTTLPIIYNGLKNLYIYNYFLICIAGPGSYLVRPSDNSPGDYSLFFHINNQIQRFRVEKKGVRYVMGGRNFDCLDAVINRYKSEQIVEGHTLGHPVKRVSYRYNDTKVAISS